MTLCWLYLHWMENTCGEGSLVLIRLSGILSDSLLVLTMLILDGTACQCKIVLDFVLLRKFLRNLLVSNNHHVIQCYNSWGNSFISVNQMKISSIITKKSCHLAKIISNVVWKLYYHVYRLITHRFGSYRIPGLYVKIYFVEELISTIML